MKSYLMTTTYQLQIMHPQESRNDISTKCETYTTIIFTPILKSIFVLLIETRNNIWIMIWLTLTSLSGSLHNKSHNRPVSGTSVGRTILRICSISCRSGLKPPWQQNIFSSIIAAIGKQLKQSVNVFHNLILYRRLHSSKKPSCHGKCRTKQIIEIFFFCAIVHLNYYNLAQKCKWNYILWIAIIVFDNSFNIKFSMEKFDWNCLFEFECKYLE